MADSPDKPCAAQNCLRPRYRDGWCALHWYAHRARLILEIEAADQPDSLAICEAIWAAS